MDDQPKDERALGEPHASRGRREPMLNIPAVVLFIIFSTTIIQFLISYVLDVGQVNLVYYYGGFVPARYGGELQGEWLPALTTPVTYAFLHGGWEHLIFNVAWLAAFGSPVAARLGTVRFAILWLVTSVIAAFAFDLSNFGGISLLVGASGAISGLTGAACRFIWTGNGISMANLSTVPARSVGATLRNSQVLIFIAFWSLANIVLAASGLSAPGAAQAVAWEAHLGGFVAGFFLFPLFDPVPQHRGD